MIKLRPDQKQKTSGPGKTGNTAARNPWNGGSIGKNTLTKRQEDKNGQNRPDSRETIKVTWPALRKSVG